MAFVIRSPKISQFDLLPQQSQQPNYQHDKHIYVNDISLPDQRIHSNVVVSSDQKGVVKDNKIREKRQDTAKGKWRGRGGKSQPLIQCGEMMFEASLVEQNRKKKCYNFKNIKKVIHQRCPSQQDEKQKQPTQFYTLPGSLKSKTMVKYTSKVGNENTTSLELSKLPGPGSYTPNLPQKCIRTLPFHKSKSSLNINDNHYMLETQLRQKKCESKYDEQIRKKNRKNNEEYSFSTADDDEGGRKNGFCLGQGKLANGYEGFFSVKYQMMNSKVFRKRGLGAVAVCNRLLMNKILCKDKQNIVVKQGSTMSKSVKNQQNKQWSQPLQQLYKQQSSWNQSCQKQQKIDQQPQYQILEQKQPGPASYNPISNPASPSSPTFSKSPRFLLKPKAQAPFLDLTSQQDPTLYNQTQIENKEQIQNPTSSFASGTHRFEDSLNGYCKQPDWDYIHRPLQYHNNFGSMTKQSHNKKYHGFEAGVYRSCQKQNFDTRPYYDVNGLNKKEILGNFTNSNQKRELFNIDQDDGPGPQKYNTCPSWHKQHSCLLKPDPKQPETSPTPCPPPPNFSLRSYNKEQNKCKPDHHHHQSLLKLKQHKRNNNLSSNSNNSCSNSSIIPSIHQGNVSENMQQVILPDRYCSHQIWESKSFNVHFSGELVKANHMCKNYLIA